MKLLKLECESSVNSQQSQVFPLPVFKVSKLFVNTIVVLSLQEMVLWKLAIFPDELISSVTELSQCRLLHSVHLQEFSCTKKECILEHL